MIWQIFLLVLCSSIFVKASNECKAKNAVLGPTINGVRYCYLYERFPAKFIIAEQNCRKSGGYLASVHNELINDFVAQVGTEAFDVMNVSSFWIGANNLRNPKQWEWTDESAFDFSNWLNYEPRDSCLALSLNGSWLGVDCFLDKPYVCQVSALILSTTPLLPKHNTTSSLQTTIEPSTTEKMDTTRLITRTERLDTTRLITTTEKLNTTRLITTTIKTTTKKHGTHCFYEWSYLNGRCYKVVNMITNPLGCFQNAAVEASIHNDEENELIGKLAQKQTIFPYENVRVKLSLLDNQNKKDKKRNWHWSDNSPVDYFKWASGEPSKKGSCVQFNSCYENSCWLKSNKNVWSVTSCLIPEKYIVCVKNA